MSLIESPRDGLLIAGKYPSSSDPVAQDQLEALIADHPPELTTENG